MVEELKFFPISGGQRMVLDGFLLLVAFVVLLHLILMLRLLHLVTIAGLRGFGGFREVHLVLLGEVDAH